MALSNEYKDFLANLPKIIYVTDKFEDFIEVKCYALNCILRVFTRPGLFPKESLKTRQELNLLFKCLKQTYAINSYPSEDSIKFVVSARHRILHNYDNP